MLAGQSVADYLGGKNNVTTQMLGSEQLDTAEGRRSYDAAMASAKGAMYERLQAMLNEQGYQNRVRVK